MQAVALENMKTLGAAWTGTDRLADLAASALRLPAVALLSASAADIAFPTFNMTTGGLWRVAGTASAGRGHDALHFSLVVKLVQSPLLWSGVDQVPMHMREALVRHFPWRTEADVYASELADAMPAGGRLPAVYAIEQIDPQRTAIWMEDIAERPGAQWSDARFAHAAAMLGRFAGSPAVRELGPRIAASMEADRLRFYLNGRGSLVLMPAIRGEELWRVPAVADVATAPLITGLRALADRAYELADELATLPALPAHGDASPQNLLIDGTADEPGGMSDFAVIDWGMYSAACAGFDLGQLLAGWVNQGLMRGEELFRLEPVCLEAYCAGLAEHGTHIPQEVVRRGHAASMALFTGLAAVPTERLTEPDSEELHAFVSGRVEMAEFVLDLLAATG